MSEVRYWILGADSRLGLACFLVLRLVNRIAMEIEMCLILVKTTEIPSSVTRYTFLQTLPGVIAYLPGVIVLLPWGECPFSVTEDSKWASDS